MKDITVKQTNRIEQSGDSVNEPAAEMPAVQIDKLLGEIGLLYLERCKATKDGNTIAFHLATLKINDLRTQLNNTSWTRAPSGRLWFSL